MFSFFKKKIFLRDLLENAVDIHNHILPGIDDGASQVSVSEKMLSLYKELGFKHIIPTPHIMESYYENTLESIPLSRKKLIEEISGSQDFIKNASAEYMLDTQFDFLLKENKILPLHDNFLLVEMSYFQKPINIEEQLFQIQQLDYIPVLAHPERYSYIKGIKDYEFFKDRGCKFQLNMLSLSEHYGKATRHKADMLLKESMIDFIATDAHRPEHLIKIGNLQVPSAMQALLQKIIKQTQESFS